MNFKWNTRKVKVEKNEGGRIVYVDSNPKEIIMNPNGQRMEALVMSLCVAVGELMEASEAQLDRMKTLAKTIEETRNGSEEATKST
jgi:hypothetical protein